MGLTIFLEQVFLRDLRVHLCGRDARVSEHFLNDAQVGTMVEHVGCTGVTENVRRQVVPQTDLIPAPHHDRPRRLSAESPTSLVDEHRSGIISISPMRRGEALTSDVEPDSQGSPRHVSERDNSLLRSLAVQANKTRIMIDVSQIEAAHL